jgi:hypothetical protein
MVTTRPEQRSTPAWSRMTLVSSERTPSVGTANARRLARRVRNDHLLDWWSLAHFGWAAALTVVIGPWWALALMLAWEPFEILLLGPLMSRWGIAFGHETWRNAASDAVFDLAGVLFGFFVVLRVWDPLGMA